MSSEELVLYTYGDEGWQVYDTNQQDNSFVMSDVTLTLDASYFVIGPRPTLTTTPLSTTPPPETKPKTTTLVPEIVLGFELLAVIAAIPVALFLTRRKK